MEVAKLNGALGFASHYLPTPISARERAETQEIVQAVQAINQAQMFGEHNELTFSFDRAARKPILKIINKQTGEVIRQIPAEYVLRLHEEIRKF